MQHETIATFLNRCSTLGRLNQELEQWLIQNNQHSVIAIQQNSVRKLKQSTITFLFGLFQQFNHRLSEEDGWAIARGGLKLHA